MSMANKRNLVTPIVERGQERRLTKRDFMIGSITSVIGGGIGVTGNQLIDISNKRKNKVTEILQKEQIDILYKERAIKAKEGFKNALLEFGIDQDLINNILNSIVIINSGDGIGTGFFIGDNIILTAGHVISDTEDKISFNYSDSNNPYSMYDLDGNRYKATNSYGDSNNDLGCIVTSEKGKGKLNISDDNLSENPERIGIGFGGGGSRTTRGKIASSFEGEKLGPLDIGKVETLSNNFIPGDSGGPVLDRNGYVRGVIIYKYQYNLDRTITDEDTGIDFNLEIKYGGAEPLADIQSFLNGMLPILNGMN